MHKWRLLLPALLLAACADENTFENGLIYTPSLTAHYLHASNLAFNVNADAQQITTDVAAIGTSWEFQGAAPWATFTPAAGTKDETVSIAINENITADTQRTTTFSFVSTNPAYPYQRSGTITQRAASPMLNVATSSVTFSAGVEQVSIAVEANMAWQLVKSDAPWLTADVSNDLSSITLSVEENLTSEARRATVTLTGQQIVRNISVIQSIAAMPVAEGHTLSFTNEGGSYVLDITSEVAWRVQTSESWLDVTPESGSAGKTEVTVLAAPNHTTHSRNGFVYITIGDNQVLSIPATQEGDTISVTPREVVFRADASTATVTVSSNTSWTVLSLPRWLTATPSSGTGSADIVLSADNNWDAVTLDGQMVIGQEGTELKATVGLSQLAREIGGDRIEFDATASEQQLEVPYAGDWTAITPVSWITLTPDHGSAGTPLRISVAANDDIDPRTSIVILQEVASHASITYAVHQQGRYFRIEPTAPAILGSKGGTHVVHIASNDEWTATSSSSWLTLSQTAGQGDIDVTLTASDNPTLEARRDTTIFTPVHMQPIMVITIQAGRYLTVDVQSLNFFSKGGSSDIITVSTDADYTATLSASWLRLEQGTVAGTFTIVAEANDTEDDRDASLTLTMTGLTDGEEFRLVIPIHQGYFTPGAVIVPFKPEEQWDIFLGSSASVGVIGFGSDKQWR